MLEELLAYTDTLKIQELDEPAAQLLYDDAIAMVVSLVDSEVLREEVIDENLHEASSILFAAQDFAHAYLKQNGQKLEGAPDDETEWELVLTPEGYKPRPLTAIELNQILYEYLRDNNPDTLPSETQ